MCSSDLVAEVTLQETEVPKKKSVKKKDTLVMDMPGTIGSAKVVFANKDSGGWPKIKQGRHLLVRTFEDGRTELEWDDDALLQEVREALASVK